MENAAIAEKSEGREALESLRSAFAAERDRRLNTVDPDEAHALVCCAREVRCLTAIAVDLNESSETRLEAAMRGLDLAGMTARSARFRECDPRELTLPELHNVLARIDVELEMCGEAA
jgi:hypothetical protein